MTTQPDNSQSRGHMDIAKQERAGLTVLLHFLTTCTWAFFAGFLIYQRDVHGAILACIAMQLSRGSRN